MSSTKLIITGILLLAVWYIIRVVQAAKRLYFGVGRVRNMRFTGGVVEWEQSIKVTNGDNVSIPIRSVNVLNYFGSSTKSAIGNTRLKQPQTIAANSTTELVFIVTVPYTDLLFVIKELVGAWQAREVALTFDGNLRSIGFNIPINQTFSIDFSTIL